MESNRKILGVIPARYESSRFPGKALALIKDKPMVQWVYEACDGVFDDLVVATDDERIKSAVEKFNGHVLMTSNKHTSGTERCLEATDILERNHSTYDIVVNVQGDEPLIKRAQLDELIRCIEVEVTEIATLVRVIDNAEDLNNPNIVKAVLNKEKQALYFSRSPIPYLRQNDPENADIFLKHIGLYAFKTSVLRKVCGLPVSRLEKAESLEQLRWLEHGFVVRAELSQYDNIGVDTPEDLSRLLASIR